MTSLNQIPGTFERSVLNSPRTFDGASGLRSQMSMWLGPPCRKIRMTDFALPQPVLPLAESEADSEPSACNRRMSPSARPNTPAPPIRMNSRRLQPSQVQPGFPGMDSIVTSILHCSSRLRHTIEFHRPHRQKDGAHKLAIK